MSWVPWIQIENEDAPIEIVAYQNMSTRIVESLSTVE